jgi:hypothetical protein
MSASETALAFVEKIIGLMITQIGYANTKNMKGF